MPIYVSKQCIIDVSKMVKSAIAETMDDVGLDETLKVAFREYDFYMGDIALKYIPQSPVAKDDEPDWDDGSDELYRKLCIFLEKKAKEVFDETTGILRTASVLIKQALA